MKGTQPIFSYAHAREELDSASIRAERRENVQKEESRKEEKSDGKNIEKDKRETPKDDGRSQCTNKGTRWIQHHCKCRPRRDVSQAEWLHPGSVHQSASFSVATPFVPDAKTPNYARSPAVAKEYHGNCNSDIILAIPMADASILSCVHDQKLRAPKLLTKRIMPLFPPAKRECDGVLTIIIFDGPVPLQWPLANWELSLWNRSCMHERWQPCMLRQEMHWIFP